MVLKEYINFEKQIDHKFLSVTHFEHRSLTDENIDISFKNNLNIFINIGNIINLDHKSNSYLLPPKNAYLLTGQNFSIPVTAGKFIKYTIIEFKDKLNNFLNENIIDSIPEMYKHIFSSESYMLDFPLNIDILTNIEELYKIDYNSDLTFSEFEIKVKSFCLIFNILKKILFMDYKYIDQISTIHTKYYAVLKNIFDNLMTLDSSLSLYNLDKSAFIEMFNNYNQSLNFDKYVEEYAEYEQI